MLRSSSLLSGSISREVALLGCLVALALGTAGYELTRGSQVTGARAVTVVSVPVAQTAVTETDRHDSLQLLVAGFPRPLVGAVPVAKDLSAEISETGSSHGDRQLQVTLRRGEAGTPVEAARILVDGSMVSMGHDSFRVGSTPMGDGTYVIVLPFTMDGQWDVALTISSGDTRGILNLSIDVGGGY